MSEKEPSKAVAPVSPFRHLWDLQEELNRLWESVPTPFGRAGRAALAPEAWVPAVDVIQKNGSVIVKAELPGLTDKDVEITVSDDAVMIKGEKSEEKETKEENYYRSERSYGHFSRQIALPAKGNPDKAKASFKDGVLEVEVPLEQPLPRQKKVAITGT
jgi:HSP20 family protein